MVFYRTYRPQTIQELDSEEVRQKLNSVLRQSAPTFLQVPHAFLFTGPKGLGKTSTARIVAKIINCTGRKDTSGKDIEPCNSCEFCLSITSGTNMDVQEIDAASNRGIDEMRDLKEKIRLAPLSARKKIYIIDEVHMLTTEAFNALLKTLEEPPSHAVFILCTTEIHKVPPTILSRCFHINFRLATEDELVRAFERILVGEGITADKKVLQEVAKLSEGGFRDGTKIIEELVALSDDKTISIELLETKFHLQSLTKYVDDLLEALEKKELEKALVSVNDVVTQGIDIKFFTSSLIDVLHIIFLAKTGVGETKSSLDLTEVTKLLELFTKAFQDTKSAVITQLPLEIAVITWCLGETEKEVGVHHSKKSHTLTDEVSVTSLRKEVGNIAKNKAAYGEEKHETAPKGNNKSEVSILKYNATGDHTEEWMDSLWKNIILQIKEHNHMLAGILRSCKLKSFDREVLIIEALSSFHKDKLEDSKNFGALKTVCDTLVGNPVEVTIELKS